MPHSSKAQQNRDTWFELRRTGQAPVSARYRIYTGEKRETITFYGAIFARIDAEGSYGSRAVWPTTQRNASARLAKHQTSNGSRIVKVA